MKLSFVMMASISWPVSVLDVSLNALNSVLLVIYTELALNATSVIS